LGYDKLPRATKQRGFERMTLCKLVRVLNEHGVRGLCLRDTPNGGLVVLPEPRNLQLPRWLTEEIRRHRWEMLEAFESDGSGPVEVLPGGTTGRTGPLHRAKRPA
jgi:hypothetical protein